jgi:hypothetical protein
MTALKRYLLILLFIGIGIGFGIGFGIIFYHIRKKKDDQITIGDCIKSIIIPSIFFWLTFGILIIIKSEYCISIEIFIISGVILAGFLSAISTKTIWMFFVGIGVAITEIGVNHIIRRIIGFVKCRANQMKAENAEKKAINS